MACHQRGEFEKWMILPKGQRIVLTAMAHVLGFVMLMAFSSHVSAGTIQGDLQQAGFSRSEASGTVYRSELQNFYAARNYAPVWFDTSGALRRKKLAKANEALLRHAYENGLNPMDYDLAALAMSGGGAESAKEWQMTNLLMRYIHDLRSGRDQPHQYDPKKFPKPHSLPLASYAATVVNASDTRTALERFAPPQAQYKLLRRHLAAFRQNQSRGGWRGVSVAPGTVIYPGESHPAIPDIRENLASLGGSGSSSDGITWIDVEPAAGGSYQETGLRQNSRYAPPVDHDNPNIYDRALLASVIKFQRTRGLKPDGVIGRETLSALSQSAGSGEQKMILTLERWRWMPENMGSKYVQLNIPAFTVYAYQNGQPVFAMPAIVGEVAHQTPVFNSEITEVKFHPDWTATDSIARRYLIKKIQRRPELIHSLGYQVIDKQTGRVVPWSRFSLESLNHIDLRRYQFRQVPGKYNALGLARFNIPNRYTVFMHGTPAMELFDAQQRTFSSGCMRLYDPLKMAKFLLHGQVPEWQIESLYDLSPDEKPETEVVGLARPVPVYITYFTAWIDGSGQLHLVPDVYGRDQKLARALSL